MPDGRPYGGRPAASRGDPRQRRVLDVSRGFMNQGPTSGSPAGPRTRPSMYPDVRGFASTPVGRMLLKSIINRQQGQQGVQRQPARRRMPPTRR